MFVSALCIAAMHIFTWQVTEAALAVRHAFLLLHIGNRDRGASGLGYALQPDSTVTITVLQLVHSCHTCDRSSCKPRLPIPSAADFTTQTTEAQLPGSDSTSVNTTQRKAKALQNKARMHAAVAASELLSSCLAKVSQLQERDAHPEPQQETPNS
jgi:hypothetical protein